MNNNGEKEQFLFGATMVAIALVILGFAKLGEWIMANQEAAIRLLFGLMGMAVAVGGAILAYKKAGK